MARVQPRTRSHRRCLWLGKISAWLTICISLTKMFCMRETVLYFVDRIVDIAVYINCKPWLSGALRQTS